MSRMVLVCGGRDFRDRETVFWALDALHAMDPISLVIEGGQRTYENGQTVGGADFLAREWARSRDIRWRTERADWQRYGRRAGPMRNARMIGMHPALVVAFPGGAGTADCVRQAREAGIPVSEVEVRNVQNVHEAMEATA